MDPEVPCSSQGGGTIPSLLFPPREIADSLGSSALVGRDRFDLDLLTQGTGRIKYQDPVIHGDDGPKVRALCNGPWLGALGKGKGLWGCERRGLHTGDKKAHDGYHPADHHHGQDNDQGPQ